MKLNIRCILMPHLQSQRGKIKMIKKFLCFVMAFSFLLCLFSGCNGTPSQPPGKESQPDSSPGDFGKDWQPEGTMELTYAENFNVTYYPDGFSFITISDGSRYLLVPEGRQAPSEIDPEIILLQQPLNRIYLAATAAMCLFDALDSLDHIGLSGTKAEGWYIPNAKTAMENGSILYAGKYNAPDYELIMAHSCDLAIESTMIYHTPEVKEKLEDIGIPVLVDQSSRELHPLGRTEWIKLYGLLMGKEPEAKKIFDQQAGYIQEISKSENTGKTVAFFYISSSGYAVARKPGDYVAKMIALAGGNYIFQGLGDSENAMSTIPLEMEQFYAQAKDADYMIYNSTIDGEVPSLESLVQKNSLLKDFKAVQNGNVWCTEKNLFQETTQLGLMISDIHQMLTEDGITKLNFLYRLE